MVPSIVQDISTALNSIEYNPTLGIASNFVARSHALEALAEQVLDRIENVLYEHGYRQELAQLYQRAEQVWQRLESINAELFAELRQQLAATSTMVTTLKQMFATYVGSTGDNYPEDPSGYDCLDLFVNGLLGIGQAPETVKTLESGMIGYHPTPARVVLAFLEHAQLSTQDVLYDVGSGLGRVVLLAGLLSPAYVKGIEVEPAYYTYAQQCAERFNLARVVYENIDARAADYTDGTVFFLYTPFTGHMFEAVLDKLYAQAQTRQITIATYGLCSRHASQQDWLHLTVNQEFGHDTLALFRSR